LRSYCCSAQYGWKFPAGKAANGEAIFDTAKRKVFEETGVTAQPDAIISLRHKVSKFNTDIGTYFFICLMHIDEEEEVKLASCVIPEFFEAWWFTREELRMLDTKHFFYHHREVFVAYDDWLKITR
ncbi:hydrolase, NUDIX family, partial [Oesophagostomum dentatum]